MSGAIHNPQPVNQPVPDWEDVRQAEPYPQVTVPVEVVGPIGVWAMPAKRGVNHQFKLDTLANMSGNAPEVVPADPRIKRAILSASTATVVVGTQEQVKDPQSPDGFVLPSGQAIPWEGFEEPLYAVANTAGAAVLSVRYEFWAD